ncbi:MAG: hypothetical protein DIU68_005560 [Chloroflexota bacterium]
MAVKKYQAGEITIYKTAATFYIGIEPSEPYRRPGIRFTIIMPPRTGAEPPFNEWQRETWISVRSRKADGKEAVEIRLLKREPLTEEQIRFFEHYR